MGEYRYVNIEEAKIIDTLPPIINFSYIRRKTVIDLLKAEDRADNEAQIMFPQDINKQVEYVYILSDKYQLEVLQNNSIPTPYYNKLVLEGFKKEWHRLKY
jgi:hypothetical protein